MFSDSKVSGCVHSEHFLNKVAIYLSYVTHFFFNSFLDLLFYAIILKFA